MKKISIKLFFLSIVVGFSASCSKENPNEELTSMNAKATIFVGQDIQKDELVGSWVIQAAKADIAVDVNSDGIENVDILKETTCFDEMYFSFDSAGNIKTLQSQLSFVDGGEMRCGNSVIYDATYKVSGNTLMVTFSVNGQEVVATKTIGLSSDASGEYLHVAIEAHEIDQFVKDPGTTSVSDVERIEIIYKKQ